MSLGKLAGIIALTAVTALFAACSGGGSSSGTNTLSSVVQNLTVDPSGKTTVLTFASSHGLAGAGAGNFIADHGQTATTATVASNMVTVVWNATISPATSVRTNGLSGVSAALHAVSTSDSSAPTYAITLGVQNAGLGGDIVHVTFSGPHVVPSDVTNLAHWVLTIDSTSMDLTGTTIGFDVPSQVATFTLGPNANLHANFSMQASAIHSVADVVVAGAVVAGTASGDSTAPSLVSAEQMLSLDEFGRVIDFTFDKAMDPVFSVALTHFTVTSPDLATSVLQPSEDVLRVTFNNPIVPGVDTVSLVSLVDLHGNAFPDTVQAITQPAPVVNAFASTPLVTTVANAGQDNVTVVTTQAFDPDSAVDPTKWSLTVGGNVIDLTTQTLDYDLLNKTLTITLVVDLLTGDAFTIQGLGVVDVDGDAFNLSASGNVTGDATPPTIVSVVQNRDVNVLGHVVDVTLSEDLDQTTAETNANWTMSGAAALTSATLLPNLKVVRLVYVPTIIPGDFTLSATGVKDLAGNALVAVSGLAVTSTDTTRPSSTVANAFAVAGANNDLLSVTFDDYLVPSEITDVANWVVESPIGSSVSTVGATAAWSNATLSATITFANGFNFQRGDGFSVQFTTARDLGGNTIQTNAQLGAVDAESVLPYLGTVYRSGTVADELIVRFSEPCAQLTDLYDALINPTGTRFVLRDSGGTQRGLATAASVQDLGLGVTLSFGVVIAATDTLDVLGVTDLCGNPMFPVLAAPTLAEDTTTPSLSPGASACTTVTGENNDVVTIVFDRPMSPWLLRDPSKYTVASTTTVDLSRIDFTFDGVSTLTLALRSGSGQNMTTGANYTVTFNDLYSAQGALRSSADSDNTIFAAGDATAPSVASDKVRLDPSDANSVLIETNEALDATTATTAANYDFGGGNVATSASQLGPRTVRATFASPPAPGDTLQLTVTDLAGNVSGTISRVVQPADTAAPLVAGVAGVIKPNWGGDIVTVDFDEPITAASALDPTHYVVTSNGHPISLAGARFTYASASNRVIISLADGVELDAGGLVTFSVSGARDYSGNTMGATVQIGGAVSGDTTPPSFSNAFVNWRQDPTGVVIDVLFSEDVDQNFASTGTNWTCSGGQTVTNVTMMERNHARLTLSAALGATDTLGMNGVPDLARNTSGAITIDPTE